MGMFYRQRRPLLRMATGAATAAVAYNAGKRRTGQAQVNEQAEAAYAATQQPVQQPVQQSASDPLDQLERLAKLHQAGSLSDEEFAAAKAKLL